MEWSNENILAVISTFLNLLGLGIYIFTIRTGKTKPHSFSWSLWGLLMMIAFLAQLTDDAGAGAWVIAISAVICFGIGAYAFFYGEKNITKSDWVAFIAALTAIPVWCLTQNPLYAVIIVSLIDATAFYPTFRKSWMKPGEEAPITYFLSTASFLLSIFALENLSYTTAIYPATLTLLNGAFAVMVLIRRRMIAQHG